MKNLFDKPLKEEYFHLGEMHCILEDAKDALKRAGGDGGDTFRTLFVRHFARQVIESVIQTVDEVMHGKERSPEESLDERLSGIWDEIHDLIEAQIKAKAPMPVVEALEEARRAVDRAQNSLSDAAILMRREDGHA